MTPTPRNQPPAVQKPVLNWETIEPQAVYPRPRYRATSADCIYEISIQGGGRWTWHLLILREKAYVNSYNCRTLDGAKRLAEQWERDAMQAAK